MRGNVYCTRGGPAATCLLAFRHSRLAGRAPRPTQEGSMAETMTAAQRGRAAHGSLTDWSGWDYLPGLAFLVIGVLALMLAPLTSAVTSIYLAVMLCVAGGFALVGGLANIRS